MTSGSLMKVESIAECSLWSILQYFWPAFSDNWSWKTILVFLRVAVLDKFYYKPNDPAFCGSVFRGAEREPNQNTASSHFRLSIETPFYPFKPNGISNPY